MNLCNRSCKLPNASSGDTANQSNRETMMSMDRIAEEISESHVQRKLRSRQWPSLLVGLFKGNSILIFSILITCFAETNAQNAFPVEFSSNATTNVKPGTPVNLTCSFKLAKDDFKNILFKLGADQLYDYMSQASFKGLQHGNYLSTDPNVDSVFWMTTNPNFCSDTSLKREYTCWVQNAAREFTQEKVEVSYQGPRLEVIVDGKYVSSPYSESLKHNRIGENIEIRIVAKNLLSTPQNMSLSVIKGSFQTIDLPSVTSKNDDTLCIYERKLTATYKFPESGEYEFKYSGPPNDETIKVTVKGKLSFIFVRVISVME